METDKSAKSRMSKNSIHLLNVAIIFTKYSQNHLKMWGIINHIYITFLLHGVVIRVAEENISKI